MIAGRFAVAWLVGCFGFTTAALGQLQSSAASKSDGLSVKAEWPVTNYAAGGYLPVQIEVTSVRGARDLRIDLDNRVYPYGSRVSRRIALEANQPQRFTLLLPLTTRSVYCTLRVYENRSELEKLRITAIGSVGGFWQESPNTMLIARAAPDWRAYERTVQNLITGTSGGNLVHPVLAPEKLTAQWIDYAVFDLVFVSLTEFEAMASGIRDAVLAWAMAGGNLVVYGVVTSDDAVRLDRLLDSSPRSQAQAQWRLPNPADRLAGTLIADRPAPRGTWPQEALERLESHGQKAYQEYCTNLLSLHGKMVRSGNDMNTLAWACVIGPDAVPDMAQVVQLAEQAVARDPRSYAIANTLGVALYRAGRHQDAIATLTRAMQLHRGGGGAADWLFLAMANHKLGRKEEAARWLAKSTVVGERDAETRLFLREAEAVLQSDAAEAAVAAHKPPDPAAAVPAAAAPAPHFSLRNFGLGRVVRIAAADPFPGTEEDWAWLFRTIGTERLRWSDRHGMTARSGNSDFWNFLIPRVGRAPVLAFQILIVLFALVIGPMNYFFLRKHGRLYLLLFTVPLLAMITSGLLLGYAMAWDGFAVRTRVRSLTYLDQVHGGGVSMTRISYYAGVAPAGGLRFSPETAVYPLEGDEGRTFRTVDWTEAQHLDGGWLRSRTPTQLVTVAHRQAGEQLVVAADSSGVLRVTNNLGCAIEAVVVCDESSRFYSGEKIAPGARVLLTAHDDAEAAAAATALIRSHVQGQSLEVPAELAGRGGIGGMPWRQYSWPAGSDWSMSLLERTLGQIAGDWPVFKGAIGPRMYVAVTGRPSFVELGVDDSLDAGSLYVIVGMY